ncbi:hypothetical protein ACLOJK_038752 [Asimina triloba]
MVTTNVDSVLTVMAAEFGERKRVVAAKWDVGKGEQVARKDGYALRSRKQKARDREWGYESIYEEDALSAAVAQIAAWKERLEMNAQWGYEEDALSAAAAQLAAWKERLKLNVVISPACNTCGATHSTKGCPSKSYDVYSSITIQATNIQSQ